jgi:hypothetical protein
VNANVSPVKLFVPEQARFSQENYTRITKRRPGRAIAAGSSRRDGLARRSNRAPVCYCDRRSANQGSSTLRTGALHPCKRSASPFWLCAVHALLPAYRGYVARYEEHRFNLPQDLLVITGSEHADIVNILSAIEEQFHERTTIGPNRQSRGAMGSLTFGSVFPCGGRVAQ